MSRLIIISNRLPVTLESSNNITTIRQSSGGLVSAITSFLEKRNSSQYSQVIWMGSIDSDRDTWKKASEENELNTAYTIHPVFVDEQCYKDFYNGFSNSTIWPLFHYFPGFTEYNKSCYNAYTAVNTQFAEELFSFYQEGDVIWIHDYQLMLLPDLIRKFLPKASIGFFLHIPFPSYEIFRLLPTQWKQQIMQGIMGADLVGFHTHDYVQHFIQSAKMTLQTESQFNQVYYGNRIVKTDLFPIGIDYEKFREACVDEVVVRISTALEEKFYNQKIIFSVDRLDYTKGLEYRLKGFEQFLTDHPEWKEKVIFILNVVPSRDSIARYSDRKRQIEENVSQINGRFSTLHWQPIIYRYNHLSFEELCGLYQSADVALITPLRDGMNLVAKEYIASCIDKGVLVLSELTGAASELNEAILVNPTDTDEVSGAILQALTMSLTEQRTRLSYMQRRIAEYDVSKWMNDFLEQLSMTKKDQEEQKINILTKDDSTRILEAYKTANKRCILLDYDGTLAPYQKLPSLAVPSPQLKKLLKDLASDERNEVVIISGRDDVTLENWLGDIPLNMIAEHGACVKYKDQPWKELATIKTEWKDQVKPLMQLFVDRCAGSFIEEKKSTLAWHYRNTEPDLGFTRSRELRNSLLQLTANTPLQVIDGNKVLEVRMVGIDKGASALAMMDNLHPDFILCIGDDATDEDMFRALKDHGWTVKIGRAHTAAQFTILSQNEVIPFLARFISSNHIISSNHPA